jgi:hypothetical protein
LNYRACRNPALTHERTKTGKRLSPYAASFRKPLEQVQDRRAAQRHMRIYRLLSFPLDE